MSIRIMSSDRSRAAPSWDNRPPVPYGPTTDQGPQQSRERGDRPEQPHQGEMSKTAVLDRDSAAPSSPAPTADRVRATESPFPAILNGLLQQNRHICDVVLCRLEFRFRRLIGL